MRNILVVLGLLGPVDVAAQEVLHPVGFRVIEARDSARAFQPKRDWTGRPAADPSRPVQISIWYPAASVDGRAAMEAWELRALAEEELVDLDPDTARERARRRHVRGMQLMNASPAEAEPLWSDTLTARRDAPAAPGRFPLVLYLTSAGVSNPGLAEHLASRGYVVASIPATGRMTEGSIAYTPNPLTLETDVADAGFALSVLRREPNVSADRVGVVTFSSSSLPALLWQMRDMQADALVLIEGWERYRTGAELVAMSPHYDPRRVRVPVLLLERAADEASPAFAKVGDVVDSLRHADVRRVSFRDALHVDFLSHVFGASEHQPEIHATGTAMIHRFLDAALKGQADAEPQASEMYAVATLPAAIPARPTEEELFRLAELNAREAERVYAATKGEGPPLFRRDVMSRAALFAVEAENRVIILGMVADAYPRSVDARYRLGDALLAADRLEDGRVTLREALDVIPADPSLDAAGREQWTRRIETRLAEVR